MVHFGCLNEPAISRRRGIKITVVDEPTEALLLRGEIDALIPPNIVPSFRAKDPRIRRVVQRRKGHGERILSQERKSFRSRTHWSCANRFSMRIPGSYRVC